jgi:hypothetical protein
MRERELVNYRKERELVISRNKAPEPSRLRYLGFALGTVSLTVVLCVVSAEIFLSFLPVQTGLRTMPVNADNPVFHFTPERDVTFSRAWNFDMVNHRRVNNAGWVNDQDYQHQDETPLLAIVGDSYIEAMMVPYANTLYGHLASTLDGRFRVYSFGASGAPLSQYLIWAGHAVREYGARAVVINVVGNDFDESHISYNTGSGWWVYAPGPDGTMRLRLIEYRPGLLRSVVYHSSLARYLFFNLQFGYAWAQIRSFFFGSPAIAAQQYAGNTLAKAESVRIEASIAAMDALFRDLQAMKGLPPDRILFTLDGFRYPEGVAGGTGTYFDLMRRAFRSKAESLGYEVIDLDTFFFKHYKAYGQRFEYPHDGHWNDLGHALAAEAILGSKLVRRLMGQHVGQ